MERIAIYGKGGIGKSTFATSASLVLSRRGNRVLHVGCDQKHDSSLVLVEDPTRFRTVMNKVFAGEEVIDPEDIIMAGIEGIDCVESGGPDAGRGCGGRAVSRSFEVFDDVAFYWFLMAAMVACMGPVSYSFLSLFLGREPVDWTAVAASRSIPKQQ